MIDRCGNETSQEYGYSRTTVSNHPFLDAPVLGEMVGVGEREDDSDEVDAPGEQQQFGTGHQLAGEHRTSLPPSRPDRDESPGTRGRNRVSGNTGIAVTTMRACMHVHDVAAFCCCSRLSGELAKMAKHVTATDLMEKFVKENELANGPAHANMTFRTLDATQLDYPANSFDLVFSNWLLMYLSDEEVDTFIRRVLKSESM